MVNINIIKKFEKEFREDIEKKEYDKIDINNLNIINKQEFKSDLTDLIDCSKDFYEDLIKIYTNEEKVLELETDTYLEIKGSGILYIIIKESLDLFLDFENKNFTGINVKILIKENLNVNLITKDIGSKLNRNLKIIAKENVNLNHILLIKNSFYSKTKIQLDKDSSYNLNGVIFQNVNKIYNNVEIQHIGDDSNSNIKIDLLSLDNSKIFSDIKTKVRKGVKFVEGHQKSKGLILNRDVQIVCEPILEIDSNEVISSHSASVSNIDKEEQFYFNSRGFSLKETQDFIVNEKVNFLIEKIGNEEFRNKLNLF